MKVFRKVGDPTRYQVVGHDGPHLLQSGMVNSFPVTIRVNPGDVLGLNTVDASAFNNSCAFAVPGEILYYRSPGLPDGVSDDFTGDVDLRLNITADVEPKPSNAITVGKAKRNKKRGTAQLPVTTPGPGTLALSGKGVKAQNATASGARAAGAVTLSVKPTGKTKKKLNETGKVKVAVTVTFTPNFGDPGPQTVKVKLSKQI
jgi:hypothetical protein